MVSLSMLFGGSASIVFAVITLVHAAKAKGIPVSEAAAANAPVFYGFSTILLVMGIMLLLAESLDFARTKRARGLILGRYIASALCVAATMIFSFGIVPPMKELAPLLKDNAEAKEKFDKLHHVSEMNFSAIIVLALVSLLIPAFENNSVKPE